ncbi:MAG: hypothetical protein ACYTGB_12660 [Planctomycetota bacterium]
MAYKCPRCGEPVSRSSNRAAGLGGGLVGILLAAAFGALQCQKCGKIPKKEFPPEDRKKMMMGSVIMVVVALVLLAIVVVALVALQ